MPRPTRPPHLSPARWQQLHTCALAVLALLLALGIVADVNVDSPRGPYDWRQRVIILLPGVCAQPADLPPTPNLPSIQFAQTPDHWPTWPAWLTCGGENATQNAHARAVGTFVGGYGSPAQLSHLLQQALQTDTGDGQSSQELSFTIRAIESFSYAGTTPTYTNSQTRQSIALSAAALDAQFRRWRSEYPNASFDLLGHSLGGAVAVYWAARVATPAEQRAIHSIITLDSPLGGYPRNFADNFFLPFFGPVAQDLLAGNPTVGDIAERGRPLARRARHAGKPHRDHDQCPRSGGTLLLGNHARCRADRRRLRLRQQQSESRLHPHLACRARADCPGTRARRHAAAQHHQRAIALCAKDKLAASPHRAQPPHPKQQSDSLAAQSGREAGIDATRHMPLAYPARRKAEAW